LYVSLVRLSQSFMSKGRTAKNPTHSKTRIG
jgi:hypothetical protein